MTREDFFQKWQERLLWLGMRGLALDTDDRPKGPFGAGRHALALPEKVQKMLAELLADAASVNAIKPPPNGAVQP